MKIDASEGDRVVFIGASVEQIKWGKCDDPNKVLKIGDEYTVDHTEMHSWHTKVYIKGVDGAFPSTAFDDV